MRATLEADIAPVVEQISMVNCHNEWDPLEEVIVGHIDNAVVPTWDVMIKATTPEQAWPFIKRSGGELYPPEITARAREELEEFVHILEAEGITVRRPEVIDFTRSYSGPDWRVEAGLYAAMPRDVFLVFGNEIIEVPMSWRSRYFEAGAYRSLLKEYFHQGARWTSAPKPELREELFVQDWEEPTVGDEMRYVINEYEPVFDAADFVRCGRDIFAQKSNVTNEFGIRWLERHLGEKYRVHTIDVIDTKPMHIDATFMPLAPGKVLINPDRIAELPPMLKKWDLLEAPQPVLEVDRQYHMCSRWISMNVFMLDEERVIVEKEEEPLIKAFRDWGFKPIPCTLKTFNIFGGGFHCCTLDVRRKGTLESYF